MTHFDIVFDGFLPILEDILTIFSQRPGGFWRLALESSQRCLENNILTLEKSKYGIIWHKIPKNV
jgi:hypothetical protein